MTTMRHDPIDPGHFVGFERPLVPARPARVADRMTRPAVTIGWQEPVADASRLMEEHHIPHLPVVDADQRLVGIVAARDLAAALAAEEARDPAAPPRALLVGHVMRGKAVAVSPSAELAVARQLMHEGQLAVLAVVENDRVVGLLTEADMARTFASAVERG